LRLFAEPLSALCLEVSLDPLEASVLTTVVPELPTLLGREIPEAPALDGQAARLRLLQTLAAVLLRVARPTLLLLEDLHWAGEDSIELLRLLTAQLRRQPLTLIGTYRQEESPELPSLLPDARVLSLQRLDRAAVEKLSQSMLGTAHADAGLI